MIDPLEMYNSARANDVVGFPKILFPMKWLAIKDFQVIAEQLNTNEEIVFSFMMYADTNVFGRNDSPSYGYHGYNDYPQQPVSGIRHWTAFGLSNKGRLYYARWIPLNSDYGDMPISSSDLTIDVDNRFLPMQSRMNISTLRKGFYDMENKKSAIMYIRSALYQTMDSLEHHKESEDGRRIYNQYVSFDEDEGDENE